MRRKPQPKFPRPWFRKGRGWYVTLGGQQTFLDADREQALARYHQLMQQPRERRAVVAESVVAIVDAFLDWCHKHRTADTYEWYRYRLELFCRTVTDLRVADLKPYHVQRWIDSTTWESGGKRNAMRAVQRAMRWAEEQGLIDRSPVAHLRKPPGGKREQVISADEWRDLLSLVPDSNFRDLLELHWETGCRPQESLIVTARNVDVLNSRWVFPQSESKTNMPRVVYLTDKAMEITRRRMADRPVGPLLTNSNGETWTTDAVNCVFGRIRIRMGKRVMKTRGIKLDEQQIAAFIKTLAPTRIIAGQEIRKSASDLREEARRKIASRIATRLAPKYCLYVIRHTWINRMLTSGVDALTVAILAGHCDAGTIAKTYQHLSLNPTHLLNQVRRLAI
jgi:integrase